MTHRDPIRGLGARNCGAADARGRTALGEGAWKFAISTWNFDHYLLKPVFHLDAECLFRATLVRWIHFGIDRARTAGGDIAGRSRPELIATQRVRPRRAEPEVNHARSQTDSPKATT